MKPETTLKEVLNPPFETHDGYIHGSKSDSYVKIYNDNLSHEEFEAFEAYIVKAVNNQWNRDFGESLRWIRLVKVGVNDRNTCPNCKVNRAKATNYCPSCGVRLLPPEEDEDESR